MAKKKETTDQGPGRIDNLAQELRTKFMEVESVGLRARRYAIVVYVGLAASLFVAGILLNHLNTSQLERDQEQHLLHATKTIEDAARTIEDKLSPVGSVVLWPGKELPENWYWCDGSPIAVNQGWNLRALSRALDGASALPKLKSAAAGMRYIIKVK